MVLAVPAVELVAAVPAAAVVAVVPAVVAAVGDLMVRWVLTLVGTISGIEPIIGWIV
jgi:hypothetical protein